MKNFVNKTVTPKKSIFDSSQWDAPFEIIQLRDDPKQLKNFFDENFTTDNMKRLFVAAFKRFEGSTEQFLIKLTQTMGGGKTHNMIALGLLDEKLLGASFKPFER